MTLQVVEKEKIMAKKVRVDKDVCIGCGVCNATCPEVFDWDDDGKMTVVVDEVPAELEQTVEDAANDCPVQAIEVEE